MKGRKLNSTTAHNPHSDIARAEGGRVAEAGGNPHVFEAARKRKTGGRVGKSLGAVAGMPSRPRLDRPGRKLGGRTGANLSPLSTAAKAS